MTFEYGTGGPRLAQRAGEIERRSEDALLGALSVSEIEPPRSKPG